MSYYVNTHYGELIIQQFWHAAIQFEDNFKTRYPMQTDIISIMCYQYIIKLISPSYWNHAGLQTKTGSCGMQRLSQCTLFTVTRLQLMKDIGIGWPALASYNERQCSPWPINSSVMKDCGLIDLQFCCNDRPATSLIVWKIT